MAIANVACPHCRLQTVASIPSGECGVTSVRKDPKHDENDGTTECGECGEQFGYEYLCKRRVEQDLPVKGSADRPQQAQ